MIDLKAQPHISKEIAGGLYHCRPPVGETEIQLLGLAKSETENLRAAYSQAEKEYEKQPDAAKDPQDKKRIAWLEKRVLAILSAKGNEDLEAEAKETSAFVDIVLLDFDHSKSKYEYLRNTVFPKGGKPSAVLPYGLKRGLRTWYENQMFVTLDEGKN